MLPAELISVIAEDVYKSDGATTWNNCCSFRRVCRKFDAAMCPLLFRAIELGQGDAPCSQAHLDHFLNHVAATQAQWIKHARIVVPFSPIMDQSPLEYSNKHHIELLGRCVQQITNLMCCHLFFVSQDPPSAWHETDLKMEYEHWEPLATALQTSPKLSVVDFASSVRNQEPGHPRDLAVYGLDELLANPNRKVVTLSYIVPASRSSSAKPALRFLGYDHITGLRSSIMCAAVGMPLLHAEPSHLYSGLSYNTLPAHLRELTLGMTFTTAYQLYKLLSSAAKTLKHLTLSCMSIEEETAEETRSISLLDLPRLNYLHMFLTSSLSSTVQDNDDDFGLRMVLNFVRRFASPALMELGISHQPSKVDFDAPLAMIKEPGFENLKIILFSFVDPLEEDISPPTFCQDGSELMRYAEQRKILMCRSEEEWCSACLDSPEGHDCC